MNTKTIIFTAKIDGHYCNTKCPHLVLITKWKYPHCSLFGKDMGGPKEQPCRCNRCINGIQMIIEQND